MNKPLTIEELKALEVGDWVWLTDEKGTGGCYARKESALYDEEETEFCFETIEIYDTWLFANYGTEWLAYKNKEEAVSEYDSLVEKVKKQTAKEILDEISKHYGGAWLIELYKKYNVEVEE